MNARELHDAIKDQADFEEDYLIGNADDRATILRALRLLAAADEEGTPETDALESAAPIDYEDARFMRRLERERKAALKALAECREDAERHRVMRDQFDRTKKISSLLLPEAHPRFNGETTYASPLAYDAAIDAARGTK